MNENAMTNQAHVITVNNLAGKDHKTELLETQMGMGCVCVCVLGGGGGGYPLETNVWLPDDRVKVGRVFLFLGLNNALSLPCTC